MKQIPTIDQVVADPVKAPIDVRAEDRFFMSQALIKAVTKDNIDSIVTYILRPEFSKELEIVVMCKICEQHPELMETPAFMRWAKKNRH